MKNFDIAKTLVTKRSEKGITQAELAKFMMVSKASVSKWEKGHSYPDITILPQLAAYFDISLDELMGYQPQMSADEIRQLYAELLKEFAIKPFVDVMNRCRVIVKKHYSCFPLLFQIGTLFANCGASQDEGTKISSIEEAKQLFVRVKTLCNDIELKQLALQAEATCEMALGNPYEVIALLKNERRYTVVPTIKAALSKSYQMLGETQEAKITLQDSILDSIFVLFSDITSYLAICTDDTDQFEEVCRRTNDMGEAIRVKVLCPIAILPFYITAAEGYLTIGNAEKALAMLETYTEIMTGDAFSLAVRGDNFFTLVDEIKDKQHREYPFVMSQCADDERSVKQDMVYAITHNSSFDALHENPRFQNLATKLEQIL